MCNKKERKRDRRWYLFPVSTLGAVYFAVHGGTRRFCFFSRRDGAGFFFPRRDGAVVFFFPRRDGPVVFFFRGGTGWLFFFFSTGRDGAVFLFFFRGPGRDGCFWRWQFFWRDGAKSLHRPAKGGINRPASRPCKALIFLFCRCVCCVYFLPIHSGHQWTYQPGSHRRKVTQDFSSTFTFCGACLNFSREKDSAIPFPRRP